MNVERIFVSVRCLPVPINRGELNRQAELLKDSLNRVLKDYLQPDVLSARDVGWVPVLNHEFILLHTYVTNVEAAVAVTIDELKRLSLLDFADVLATRS